MKIAIFTDAYKPEINGVTTSIDIFRDQLSAMGHQVYVFGPQYNRGQWEDPMVYRFPSIPYFFSMMKERRFVLPSIRLIARVKSLGIEVIHSQVPGNTGVYALVASWLFGVPHVHTYHTLYMQYTHYMPLPRAFTSRAVAWISRKFCGRCQRVVTPSRQIRDEIRTYGVDAPLDVIPTGIDLRADRTLISAGQIRARLCVPPGKKLLSFVGRIGREKSIDFLLHVVKELSARRDDFHFAIVGDGPDRRALEKLSGSLGISGHVTFTGYIPREQVFSVYNTSDLFVFSSRTETQGLVLLEAMSVGTPVVAVRAMGVSDLLEDGQGGALSRFDVNEFAGHVERLLDSKSERLLKSKEAREKAFRWSIQNMAARLLTCYEESIEDFRRNGMPRYRRRNWPTRTLFETAPGNRERP